MSERRSRRTPHGVSSLSLHVVWCRQKDRRQILGGRVAVSCGDLRDQFADDHGWPIAVKEVMPNHVHLFVRVGPTVAPAAVARAFKARIARLLRQEFPNLRRHAKSLSSPPYFFGSVGYVSQSTVRCDIDHQWDVVSA